MKIGNVSIHFGFHNLKSTSRFFVCIYFKRLYGKHDRAFTFRIEMHSTYITKLQCINYSDTHTKTPIYGGVAPRSKQKQL